MADQSKEYLNTNVKSIYQPMIEDILKTKPNDPVRIQYYLNYCKLILI